MTVSEFAQGYKRLQKPDLQLNFVSQHMKRTYAPIGEKNALLQKLTDDCVLIDKNGIPYLNMVANKINFIYAMVILYMDLEMDKVNKDENKNDILGAYDSLQESGAVDDICKCLGEREVNELTFVNKEVLDTWYNAHASTRAYLAGLTEKAVKTMMALSELLGREKLDINSDTLMKFFGIPEEMEQK